MNAWVTLLTQPDYLPGVRTLRASLTRVGTRYPLLVMVTAAIDGPARQVLEDDGCLVREVEPLRPVSDDGKGYANARFAEVWTKLRAWDLTDLERVVVLDADMLVVAPMDELFDLDLGPGAIAACHACRCNPNRIASYPADWTPESCAYTYLAAGAGLPQSMSAYLNGGLLVLRPDHEVFEDMVARLSGLDDLSGHPFAEQDFLNDYYRGRWVPLSYGYNALKTLPFQHPALWDPTAVKNIHYIIDKPWQGGLAPTDRYQPLHALWWDVAADVPIDPVPVT
ncbi:glycosyltransferase family 8 protein [uncultured Jatrophihabitans sp.]|uniref:glycosyltransferase family 8 protein n=1 Tax=uncultured Jatrophihabitans sp. TaxID=1610747 RepID=UPI0035C9A717